MENTQGNVQGLLGKGMGNILGPPFPIYDHTNTSDHHISVDNFSIVGREAQNTTRIIKDSESVIHFSIGVLAIAVALHMRSAPAQYICSPP